MNLKHSRIRINQAKFCLLGLSILFLITGSCARRDTNSTVDSLINGTIYASLRSYDTSAIFSNLGTNVIVAGYTDLLKNATSLKSATDSMTTCNTTSLQNLQDLWKTNFYSLKLIEIVQFGPAVQGGYYEIMDPWPTSYLSNPADTTSINSYVSGSTTIDTTTISALNKLQRGLPAIEYLLFDNGSGITSLSSICTALTGRRLSLLTYLVADYYSKTLSLKNAWVESGGNFLAELTNAGLGSSFFESKKQALDTLITQMVNILNNIVDKKVGYPAGLNIASGGTIRSTFIESRFADSSVDGLVANLISLQSFYTGNGRAGISDYVRASNPILDRKIASQIDDAISKTKLISNLRTSLASSDLTKIRDSYEAVRSLRVTLTTDLSSLSGTGTSTVTGDGD